MNKNNFKTIIEHNMMLGLVSVYIRKFSFIENSSPYMYFSYRFHGSYVHLQRRCRKLAPSLKTFLTLIVVLLIR